VHELVFNTCACLSYSVWATSSDIGRTSKRNQNEESNKRGKIIFVNNQPDAQFYFMNVYLYSLLVSGSHVPIIRRINFINTTSGM
jgi:hypothetical protein